MWLYYFSLIYLLPYNLKGPSVTSYFQKEITKIIALIIRLTLTALHLDYFAPPPTSNFIKKFLASLLYAPERGVLAHGVPFAIPQKGWLMAYRRQVNGGAILNIFGMRPPFIRALPTFDRREWFLNGYLLRYDTMSETRAYSVITYILKNRRSISDEFWHDSFGRCWLRAGCALNLLWNND